MLCKGTGKKLCCRYTTPDSVACLRPIVHLATIKWICTFLLHLLLDLPVAWLTAGGSKRWNSVAKCFLPPALPLSPSLVIWFLFSKRTQRFPFWRFTECHYPEEKYLVKLKTFRTKLVLIKMPFQQTTLTPPMTKRTSSRSGILEAKQRWDLVAYQHRKHSYPRQVEIKACPKNNELGKNLNKHF